MIESPRPRSVARPVARCGVAAGGPARDEGAAVPAGATAVIRSHPSCDAPALAGRRELVEQEPAGERRTSGHGSDQSGVGLGRRAARRRALRAGAPAWNRRAAARATRPSARLPPEESTARTGPKPGAPAARGSQAVAAAPGTDRAKEPRVALSLDLTGVVAGLDEPAFDRDVISHGTRMTGPRLFYLLGQGAVGSRGVQHGTRRRAFQGVGARSGARDPGRITYVRARARYHISHGMPLARRLPGRSSFGLG
jgi:hypothetical protein